MAQYMTVLLQAKGDVCDRRYERGAVVEYDSVPNIAMTAVDDAARAMKVKAAHFLDPLALRATRSANATFAAS